MIKLSSKEQIDQWLTSQNLTMVYFSGARCGACTAIKDKLEQLLGGYRQIACAEIDGEINKALAVQYGVYAVPLLIIFIEGKEVWREGRYLNFSQLQDRLARYQQLLSEAEGVNLNAD